MSMPAITFYDIASGPPVRPFAPNPWKTRYALNFKRLHSGLKYKTSWVDLTKVTEVRKSLGLSPVRKHMDGSDFYTLPIIVDHSAGETVGDSFEIAVYLDNQYPSRDGEPVLFPESSMALLRVFNEHIDQLFTRHVVLVSNTFPFNPETAEQSKAGFCQRSGRKSWDEIIVVGEARAPLLESFETALGQVAKLYTRQNEGPFLNGAVPFYADIIIGGWLHMMKETLSEWQMLRNWHGGHWGKVYDALEKYAEIY